jgi:hypothetical protein
MPTPAAYLHNRKLDRESRRETEAVPLTSLVKAGEAGECQAAVGHLVGVEMFAVFAFSVMLPSPRTGHESPRAAGCN